LLTNGFVVKDDTGRVETYDTNGKLQSVVEIDGYRQDMVYGGDQLIAVTDSSGRQLTFGYTVMDYTYTTRGWISTVTVRAVASGQPDAGDATTRLDYDPTGIVRKVTDADGVTTTYGYDAAHRLTDVADALGDRVHYTLDAAGNRTAEKVMAANGTVTRSLGRTFNNLGQLTALVDGLNHTVFAAKFADSYDGNGNLVHSQDGLSVQQKQVYDGLNRLVSTLKDYNGSNTATANAQTVTTYDARDRMTGFSDPDGLNTTYDIDAFGNTAGVHSPDTGTTTFGFDIAGNRTSSLDATGVATTSTYDAAGRVTGTTYPDSSLNVQYKYDEDDSVTGCAGSVGKGHLTRVIEGNGGIVYCYDGRGNVVSKRQTLNADARPVRYTWTLGNRLVSVTTGNGTLVTYTRNPNGQIASVTATPAGGSPTLVASNLTYRPFGPIASYTLGNGQVITRTYDANDQVMDIDSPAFSLHLARDAMGNVKALGNVHGGSPATDTYGYDALYRLTESTDSTEAVIEAYTYNKTGDRLSKVAPGLLTGSYSYQAGTHRLTGVGTTVPQVDARGNTTADALPSGVFGYGYDQRNRLTTVQNGGAVVGTYVLNALGQRVLKTAGGAATRFDYNEANRLLSEGAGTITRDYVWLDDLPVGIVDRSSSSTTVRFVHADGLGSPRAVTDIPGALQWQWPYASNPFGEKAPTSSTGYTLNLRFPGQYFDVESGLAYNVNRDYESVTGRYIQSDPIGLAGGVSTFSYALANPASQSDLLGLVTGVTVWQPVGWGESSFGHISTNINGTTYSFGPKGMTVIPTDEYLSKNSFRDGTEVTLNLTPEQEEMLKNSLLKPQGDYSPLKNNCGSPLQRGLESLGIDTGNQTLPVSLGNQLLDMGMTNGVIDHAPSNPSNGTNAPWAR
jgi:RHS repeat-associated protein